MKREPMAPPVGYSVQMAQGTGLGPVGPMVVTTGQEMGKAEWVDPPMAPSAMAYPEPPMAPSVYKPTSTIATNQDDDDDFDEPDIFIPAAPGQESKSSTNGSAPALTPVIPPSAPVIPPSAPPSAPSDKKEDDSEPGPGTRGPGPGTMGPTGYTYIKATALVKLTQTY